MSGETNSEVLSKEQIISNKESLDNKYIVIKRKDVSKYLTYSQSQELDSILHFINTNRILNDKEIVEAVVVESNWEIYNEVVAIVVSQIQRDRFETMIQETNNKLE